MTDLNLKTEFIHECFKVILAINFPRSKGYRCRNYINLGVLELSNIYQWHWNLVVEYRFTKERVTWTYKRKQQSDSTHWHCATADTGLYTGFRLEVHLSPRKGSPGTSVRNPLLKKGLLYYVFYTLLYLLYSNCELESYVYGRRIYELHY